MLGDLGSGSSLHAKYSARNSSSFTMSRRLGLCACEHGMRSGSLRFSKLEHTQIEQLPNLAHILELDVNDLLAQLVQHLPTAQFVCCRDGCDSIVAWRDAVDAAGRCQRHNRQANCNNTTDVLRAGAWGIKASNVERMFGLPRHGQPKYRNRMEYSFVRDDACLL